jgi:hypothetical protein
MKNKTRFSFSLLFVVIMLLTISTLTPATPSRAQGGDTETPTPTPYPQSVLISPIGTVSTWTNNFHWTGIDDSTWYLIIVRNGAGENIIATWLNKSTFDCPLNDCNYAPAETASLAPGNYSWSIVDYGGYGYLFGNYENFTILDEPTPTYTDTPVITATYTETTIPTETNTPGPTLTPLPLQPTITYGDYMIVTVMMGLCGVVILAAFALFITLQMKKGK